MNKIINRISIALSDVTRREIIRVLIDSEKTTSELEQYIDGGKGVVLRHVDLLEEAGIIESRREGRRRVVGLTAQPFVPLQHWIGEIQTKISKKA